MRTQIKLNSVIPHGVGSGPESGAIDLIYTFLLDKFGQSIYSYISINQIGSELNEFVMKESGKNIHVNIRYPTYDNFETMSVDEKNKIRLEVVHSGLLRIADYDKKLSAEKLEEIKREVLNKNFSFEFDLKIFKNKKNASLIAKITVQPGMDKFDYFLLIEESGNEICKILIYKGRTNIFYFDQLFNVGKWKNDEELIITGKEKQIQLRVFIDRCKVEYINLTPYSKPPLFEMFRADISDADRDKAHKDWMHSLPPAIAANVRESEN